MKLFDSDSRDRLAIETTAHLGCPLEPARDGVPGNPLDPSNRGNADTLDSESDDRIKRSSSMLETVVGRAFRRSERLSALDAPVSTAFPGPRSVETVADDAPGTDFSVQRTLGVETAELLHFAGPCRRKNCVFRNRAQTLPRTPVRRRPPTLDSGSTLKGLNRERLDAQLGSVEFEDGSMKLLSGGQIKAVLKRRDALLAHLQKLIEERGEAMVLFNYDDFPRLER